MWGPLTSFFSSKYANSAMVWIVLPSPCGVITRYTNFWDNELLEQAVRRNMLLLPPGNIAHFHIHPQDIPGWTRDDRCALFVMKALLQALHDVDQPASKWQSDVNMHFLWNDTQKRGLSTEFVDNKSAYHLISKNPIKVIAVQRCHPFQSCMHTPNAMKWVGRLIA